MTNKPVVVVDATPFMCMESNTRQFSYFGKLFQEILIPGAVADELVHKSSITPEEYLKHYTLDRLVKIIKPVQLESFVSGHRPPLDKGEAEAISLAYQKKVSLVIQEKRGRNFANRHDVPAYHMSAFVVRAYKLGELSLTEAQEMLKGLHDVQMNSVKFYEQFLNDLNNG